MDLSRPQGDDEVFIVALACSLDGCSTKVKARGRCKKHYEEWLADPAHSHLKIKRTSYPDPGDLIALFKKYRQINPVAAELGISRSSLRDYLKSRPELDAACRQWLGLPEEVKRQRQVDAGRRWRSNNRERRREINRRWAANRSSEDVRKWNKYNTDRRVRQVGPRLGVGEALEAHAYETLLRRDPCVFCGASAGTIDHIQAINRGGTDHWTNLAGACASCNSSKRDKSLLEFLLWRLDAVA